MSAVSVLEEGASEREGAPITNKSSSPDEAPPSTTTKTLSYVEFYCGVGGWTMALEEAVQRIVGIDSTTTIKLERLAALDHSDLCLGVLQHNFPSSASPTATSTNDKKKKRRRIEKTVAIERLSLKQVQDWHADIWVMSPPCQPHTRQHVNQQEDVDDPRSKSFLHLLQLLQHELSEDSLPQLILLENVVGFESSKSCDQWRRALEQRHYRTAHFHLTPTQVGLPNDRPRYFCVAVRCGENATNSEDEWSTLLTSEDAKEPISIRTQLLEMGIVPPLEQSTLLPPISSFLDKVQQENLCVPAKLLNSQAAWCFDIVTPANNTSNARRSSACFTSSYGKFVRGTGSVLYEGKDNADLLSLQSPQDRQFDATWAEGLQLEQNLRYFSGSEMARLFGFAPRFEFPPLTSMKQQWKLMGNSLNVRVAARLCELGLRVVLKKKKKGTMN